RFVATAVSEVTAGACNHDTHRARHDDLARRSLCHYSGTNVYRDPAKLPAHHLAFASVDSGPDSKPQPRSPINDRGRAKNRPRRSVEMDKKAIACAVDLATTMEVQFAADKRVVGFNERPPATVAKVRSDGRRVGD